MNDIDIYKYNFDQTKYDFYDQDIIDRNFKDQHFPNGEKDIVKGTKEIRVLLNSSIYEKDSQAILLYIADLGKCSRKKFADCLKQQYRELTNIQILHLYNYIIFRRYLSYDRESLYKIANKLMKTVKENYVRNKKNNDKGSCYEHKTSIIGSAACHYGDLFILCNYYSDECVITISWSHRKVSLKDIENIREAFFPKEKYYVNVSDSDLPNSRGIMLRRKHIYNWFNLRSMCFSLIVTSGIIIYYLIKHL